MDEKFSSEQGHQVSTSPISSSPPTSQVGDHITFQNVAELLERIANAATMKKKEDYLHRYFDHFRKKFQSAHGSLDPPAENGDSIFCLARILLPNEDKKRSAYGIRGPVLARLFTKALGLDEVSADGTKLMHYKDPVKAKSGAGDLGNIIYIILQKRQSGMAGHGHTGPSLTELNGVLDKLAYATALDEQRRVLQGFMPKLTPLEGKWLARIILKHLGLGLSKSIIFKNIHPKAQELLAKTNDLELVCLKLNDPNAVLVEDPLFLFKPFEQMLCGRFLVKYEASELDPSRKRESFENLPPFPLLCEIKYDGERFQMHFDASRPPADQFRWFSRSRIDYTSNFETILTKDLKQLMRPGVQSCILDGEMMACRRDGGGYTHKAHQVDVRHMEKDPFHRPCFVVFDVIYFNGESIMGRPLEQRMETVRSIFEYKPGVVVMSEQKMIKSKEELLEELNEAVANGQEGLIVKDLKSVYEIGTRSNHWLKVKPEYFSEHSVADLDLVIVGAYYTHSVRKLGLLNHFVVGLVDKSEPGKEVFYPVTRVGPGCLRHSEVADLIKQLEPHFVHKEDPKFNVLFKGIIRPDLYIDPKKSVVVTIKAMEILPNPDRALKFTLRFPRLLQIRQDKSWRDILTLQEFCEIQKTYGGSLHRPTKHHAIRHPVLLKQASPPRLRTPSPKRKEVFNIASPAGGLFTVKPKKNISLKAASVTPVKVIQNIFENRVFCVIGSSSWKKETEKLLLTYGAQIVQNPTADLTAIIAEDKSAKVETLMKTHKYDVLKISWVEDCINTAALVDISPKVAFALSNKTMKTLCAQYDEYGDSYTEFLSNEQTQELLYKVVQMTDSCTEKTEENGGAIICKELTEDFLENELDWPDNGKIRKYSFLQGCKFVFKNETEWDCSELFGFKMQIEFYGGSVVSSEDEATHVVLPLSSSAVTFEKSADSGPLVISVDELQEWFKRHAICRP